MKTRVNAPLWVVAGLALTALVGIAPAPTRQDVDPFSHRYEFEKRGVDVSELLPQVESALALKLTGKDQNGYVLQEGDRLVFAMKEALTDGQKRTLQETVSKTREYSPEELRGKYPDRSETRKAPGEWKKRYAEAKTDADRLKILAQYVGLEEK